MSQLQTNENEILQKEGWSDLPTDLLLRILKILNPKLTDQICMSCVCRHWQSAFRQLPLSPGHLPWLLLPSTSTASRFYSCIDDSTHPLPLSISKTALLFGSASGWLLAVKTQKHNKFSFTLKNPFTGESISLPCPEPNCPLSYVQSSGYTLLWDRSDSTVVAACRGSRGMFYCHLGDTEKKWKMAKCVQEVPVESVTCYKSKFYVYNGLNIIILAVRETPRIDGLLLGHPRWPDSKRLNLVGSSGKSLIFLIKSNDLRNILDYYSIYERDMKPFNDLWRRYAKNIENHAIFLDDLHCFSVEVDEKSKFKRNCLYVAESKRNGSSVVYTVDVINLTETKQGQTRTCFSEFRIDSPPDEEVCPPTWILPSLHC